MAHSVPLKMAPTLAKFLPDDTDERYMSRRPCLSCWRRGRSVIGMGAASVDDADADVAAGAEAEARGAAAATVFPAAVGAGMAEVRGFMAALGEAVVLGFAAGTFTGRGCDIGVS